MVGIIGAMDIEIDLISKEMTNKEIRTISGVTYIKGEINSNPLVVAVCGIGKVFAAICAQTMILKYGVDKIINTGVAGSLSDEIGVMDCVVAKALVQHDVDTTYFGDPMGMISGINIVELPCDENLAQEICENIEGKVFRGIIASGDCFVANDEKKKKIADTFNAVACEMEGASIAHVCYVNKIPCCVLRTISDGANGDKVMSYEAFREQAAQKAAQIIIKTIEKQ